MVKFNEVISNFYCVQKDFTYLQSINFYRILEEECYECYINVILCDYQFDDRKKRLSVTFEKIRDFKIGNLEGIFKSIINIIDVREHQMEGINYKVKEEENELFSFYCRTFRFELI